MLFIKKGLDCNMEADEELGRLSAALHRRSERASSWTTGKRPEGWRGSVKQVRVTGTKTGEEADGAGS